MNVGSLTYFIVFRCSIINLPPLPCQEMNLSLASKLYSKYVIGKTKDTIKNGVILRWTLKGGSVHQTGNAVRDETEAWVNERVPPNDGIEQTYSYYQLKRTIDQGNYMLHCAMHFVAMNTLERLNCPGVDAARWDEMLVRGIQPNLG